MILTLFLIIGEFDQKITNSTICSHFQIIDNPLNLIDDKFTTDLIKLLITICNYRIEYNKPLLLSSIIPANVYDLSKNQRYTNSEHFMNGFSEILSLYHLLGKNLFE